MALIKNKINKKLNLPEININIVALMDILTVLLFFLVKSFTVTSSTLTTADDIRLPTTIIDDKAKETITISLSKNELRFNNEILIKLKNGKFPASVIGSDSRTLLPLKKLLVKEDKKRRAVFAGMENSQFLPPGKILIQSDKDLPFKLLKYLLHTSATSGYKDFQFLVENKDS